jgi:acetyltransferase-like isoleucine patch superfamily enzyme
MLPSSIRAFIQAICFVLPWGIRRGILARAFGYKIDRSAYIGMSIILADEAILGPKTYIGSFNYIGRLDRLVLGEAAWIGNYNWIIGLSRRLNSPFFKSKPTRRSDLILGRGSSIAAACLIDCTDRIEIGDLSGVAGWRSQILTHGIDVIRMRQTCAPVFIGANCMIATGAIIMKGVTIAPCTIVGAGSVVTKSVREQYTIVAGNPAVFVRDVPTTAGYFHRTPGPIY